jgi:hypothetical protein
VSVAKRNRQLYGLYGRLDRVEQIARQRITRRMNHPIAKQQNKDQDNRRDQSARKPSLTLPHGRQSAPERRALWQSNCLTSLAWIGSDKIAHPCSSDLTKGGRRFECPRGLQTNGKL